MRVAPLTQNDITPWAALLATAFNREADQMVQLLHFLMSETQLVAWGAWDGSTLAAQYSCLQRDLYVPMQQGCRPVGLSINMAVHPNYRGQGLVKNVAAPVYEALADRGVVAGVGFSNAAGVQVDKRSSGYGYLVVGKLRPYLFWLRATPPTNDFFLTSQWPDLPFQPAARETAVHFAWTPASLRQRFACHPFRHYSFGVWKQDSSVAGLVVYRPIRLAGVPAVALLAAYGRDHTSLLQRFTSALSSRGTRWIHLAATPAAGTAALLRKTAVALPQPFSRNPYYLTLKPLSAWLPPDVFRLENWSCLGGDVL
ncbi:MAG: GNAT family N-acetyltransferase [Anaerolineae bacterium]|nr:GNAT family N-acetyltransferase [Anaerolineae bacterium]